MYTSSGIKGKYIYVWNDVDSQSMIVSGVKFKDLVFLLSAKKGIVLIRRNNNYEETNKEYVIACIALTDVANMSDEECYSWGDFCWADCSSSLNQGVSDSVSKELLFFADNKIPEKSTNIPMLGNEFLVTAHDDGWYMRIFYTEWNAVIKLLDGKIDALSNEQVSIFKAGVVGFWIQNNSVYEEEKTFDVDSVINRRLNLTSNYWE